MKLANKLRQYIYSLRVACIRRRILYQQLDSLTDYGFIDRALSGERKS